MLPNQPRISPVTPVYVCYLLRFLGLDAVIPVFNTTPATFEIEIALNIYHINNNHECITTNYLIANAYSKINKYQADS